MSDIETTLHNVTNTQQQQLTSVLAELQPVWREILLDALQQVDGQTIQDWLQTEKLREWVQQGRRILTNRGKRKAQRASAFFAATPLILPVLTRRELEEWVHMGLDLESPDHPEIFSFLPDGLGELPESERLSCYRLARTTAYHSPQTALVLYRAVPRACRRVPAGVRGLLLRCMQAAATFDPTPLPVAVSLLSATLHNLPPESCASLLERIAQLAQLFPAGVARLFRALGRAYDEVGEAGVLAWIAAGEEIARRNPEAGEAFFALESRTSLLTLRGASPSVMLSDVHGVLLKYLHMLSGTALSLTETEDLSFPPPLVAGLEDALPLPVWIEVFPTYEENFRLYRVMAAHQAGRVEFGTYDISLPELWPSLPPFVHKLAGPEAVPPDDLLSFFRLFPRPAQIEALFLFLEGRRVTALLASTYRGLQEDLSWAESLTHLFPAALSMVLHRLPTSLPELGEDATAADSLLLATELYGSFLYEESSSSSPSQSVSQPEPEEELAEDESAMLVPTEEEEEGGSQGMSLSAEEQALLRKIIARLREHQRGKKKPERKRGTMTTLDLFTNPEELAEEEELPTPQRKTTDRRVVSEAGVRYVYDEWDYLIEDYRAQWCHLREIPLSGDEGAFFSSTLAAYSDLMPDIKREFQRLRPRMYRLVKGLEHGEEIDLDAAVAARVDRRTGITPSSKLYAARQPVERDVSVLFLLDLSASTDMRLPVKPSDETPAKDRGDLRVIDILKEAVVLLSVALEEIGDTYAIYGFSSAGRRNVEVYPVKAFVESLSIEVRGRISTLAPRRSTRMGTAVRHATRKLKDLSSRAKILVLLSDGYPEDADYGRDQHMPTYGIRDTMMALREAERSGILSFCLTVDKGGQDYLREMCAPSRYMVIEDVASLPVELPKIYQRHIRSQQL
jgi:hypothetical protein